MNTKDLPGTLLAPSSDHDTVIALTRENQALGVTNADLRLKNELLQEQCKLLVSLLYGKKSEKRGAPETSALQPLLFDEPAAVPAPEATSCSPSPGMPPSMTAAAAAGPPAGV